MLSFRIALGSVTVALALVAALPTARLAAQAEPSARPKVLVIATGGTIAGVQDSAGTLGRYRAGTLTAEAIIASVPELARFAEVEAEQFSNVASTLITPEQWVALSRRINTVLSERADLAGVVVTHGTDRLEETAFFLYLTVRSVKPVVVVGAQRPATGISPDGPINLLAAVRTVASPAARDKGVMVVMDDRILSAREVRKQYQRVGGFSVGEMGMLGVVASDGPAFFFAPVRRHGPASEFDLRGIDSLPRVELTFSYPGGSGIRFAADSLPAGLVVSTTGFTRAENLAYRALRRAGVVLVTVFSSGDNVSGAPGGGGMPIDTTVPPVTAADSLRYLEATTPRAIVAQHLTPQKARILLMLALTRTRDPVEIQRYFSEY
jgi:L-asparaginase